MPRIEKHLAVVLGLALCRDTHMLGINAIDHGPQSSLYTAGRDGTVLQWTPRTAAAPAPLPPPPASPATPATLSPYPLSPGDLHVAEAYPLHADWINDVRLVDGGSMLVTASSDQSIKVTPVGRPGDSAVLGTHCDYVKRLACADAASPSPTLVSGGLDKRVCVWDVARRARVLEWANPDPRGLVYALDATPSLVALGGPDNVVTLWDPRVQAALGTIHQLRGHTDTVKTLALTLQYVLLGLLDTSVKLWCLRTNRLLRNFDFHGGAVWTLEAAAGADGSIRSFVLGDRLGYVVASDLGSGGSGDVHTLVAQHQGAVLAVHSLADRTLWTASDEGLARYAVPITSDVAAYRARTELAGENSGLDETSGFDVTSGLEFDGEFGGPGINTFSGLGQQLDSSNTSTEDSGTVFLSASGGPVLDIAVAPGDADASGLCRDLVLLPEFAPAYVVPFNNRPQEYHATEPAKAVMRAAVLNHRRTVMCLHHDGTVVWWDLMALAPTRTTKLHVDEAEFANDEHHRMLLLRDRFDALVQELQPEESVPLWCKALTKAGRLTVSLALPGYLAAEVYWDDFVANYTFLQFEGLADDRLCVGMVMTANLLRPWVEAEVAQDAAARAGELRRALQQRLAQQGSEVTLASPRAELRGESRGESRGELKNSKGDGGKIKKLFGRSKKETPATAAAAGPVTAGSSQGSTPDSNAGEAPEPQPEPEALADNVHSTLSTLRSEYLTGKSLAELKESRMAPPKTPVMELPGPTEVVVQQLGGEYGDGREVFRFTLAQVRAAMAQGGEVQTAMMEELRTHLPRWVGDGFVLGRFPAREHPKIGFVVREKVEPDAPRDAQLPALDHSNTRLNANHALRVRKILAHVVERFTSKTAEMKRGDAPEDWLELICNGKVLPLGMTLMSIKLTIWKSGGDVVLYYRRKQ